MLNFHLEEEKRFVEEHMSKIAHLISSSNENENGLKQVEHAILN